MKDSAKRNILQIFTSCTLLANVFMPQIVVAQTIEDNNSGSENTINTSATSETNINQTNTANTSTSVNVSLNTGGNSINSSTGNSSINTGDTTFVAQVETQVNASSVEARCCEEGSDTTRIADNNSNSTNTINTTEESSTNINVTQNANVTNKVSATLNTGGNNIDNSTGTSSIVTGDVKVQGKIVNGPINIADVKVYDPQITSYSVIAGNNSNTQNTIYSSFKKDIDIKTNHWSKITNDIGFWLDSGNNSITNNMGKSSINTGNISFAFLIENGPINVSRVEYGCCSCNPQPPTPTVTPTNTLTPTPTTPSGNGGGGGGGGGGDGSSSPSVQRVASMVLGATGSFWENIFYLLFSFGCLSIGIGMRNSKQLDFAFLNNSLQRIKKKTVDLIETKCELVFYI